MEKKYSLKDLFEVLEVLLGENGCPWDRAQTHESLIPGLLEECHEVRDAVNNRNNGALCEELGDVLFHIIFHCKLAEKAEKFDFNDIVDGIASKMINRHSHIFGKDQANTPDEVVVNWEIQKQKEKGYATIEDSLREIPKTFPELLRAEKVLKKINASKKMFKSDGELIDSIIFELEKLKSENDEKEERIGRILLKIADISVKTKINSEIALTNAIETYINEFVYIQKSDAN